MAAKFWVGGGTNTNWNSSPTTNWANTSGGAGNQTAPTTGDDVTFDGSSGTGAAVWNTTISLASLVCNASKNLVSGAGAFTISSGNMSLPGGVGSTYTGTNAFTITGTSGTQTITSNGKTFGGLLTLNGSGGTFQLQDAFNSTASITLTAGTFDCQTFTVACNVFTGTGASTRELKGSGTWTITNTTSQMWNVAASGLTITNFTSAIIIAGTSASSRGFAGAGLSYGPLTINANTGRGNLGISGANTFSSVTINGPNFVSFANGATNTISNAFTWGGGASTPILVASQSTEVSAILQRLSWYTSFYPNFHISQRLR